MRILIAAAISAILLIPTGAIAGRDVADEMTLERARQCVIQQRAQERAFQACLAAAKTEAQAIQCHDLLKHRT